MENLKNFGLVNTVIGKNLLGYSVSVEDNSHNLAAGVEYNYNLIFSKIIEKRFIFWKYKKSIEFDRFILTSEKQIDKEQLEFETKSFNDLLDYGKKIGLTNGDRPLGYLIIPSGY